MQREFEDEFRPSGSNCSNFEKPRVKKNEILLLLTFISILTVITLFDANIETSAFFTAISKPLGGLFLAVPVFFAYSFKRR